MDKELKQKWIEALRSGKYAQCKGRLHKGSGYCCLGVLCEVAGVKYRSESSWLPPDLARMGGVPEEQERTLVVMNDPSGKSFAEIADYIEANL